MSAPDHGSVAWRAAAFAYPERPPALGRSTSTSRPGPSCSSSASPAAASRTLLRTVNGLVPHTSGGRFSGDVVAGGRSITTHRPRDLADVVGFVHQTPEAQFVVDHVEHDIAFVLENLGTDAATMRRRVEEVLDALGRRPPARPLPGHPVGRRAPALRRRRRAGRRARRSWCSTSRPRCSTRRAPTT